VSEPKIIIAGTGRAGTTLLVAMLSDLGLDTGFRPGVRMDGVSGGLERSLQAPNSPRIIKSPGLSTRLGELIERGSVEVAHVIVPVRDLDVAAASRVRVAGYGRFLGVPGGFHGTRTASRQRRVLDSMLAQLMWTITRFDLPHTMLEFPRFAMDWQYTYEKLGFLDPSLTAEDFKRVMAERFDPGQIREEPLTRGERLQAALLQPWTLARRVAARVRRARNGDGARLETAKKPADGRTPGTPAGPRATPASPLPGTPSTARGHALGVRTMISRNRVWRLWRARNLRFRARGPLEGPNEWSIISAPSSSEPAPSPELVHFAIEAGRRALETDLPVLRQRRPGDASRITRITGQHYRILAGLTSAWGARRVIEVGTARGASALAILDAPTVENLITFDLIGWKDFDYSWLRDEDFGPRLEQRLGDLSDPDFFARNKDDLARADMIFIDASKNGVFEPVFLARLFAVEPAGPQLIVLDDIRVLTMIRAWREIPHDKLDLTSFGHWSGTGIVARGGFPHH
jgi:predicted O-methyltransferase YrrM